MKGYFTANIRSRSHGGKPVTLPAAVTPIRRRPGKPPGHPKPPGSGRKPGTPNKSTSEIRAIAQKHGSKAINKLVGLLKSQNEATALKAAVELLDRAYGRPITPSEVTGRDGEPLIPTTRRAKLMSKFERARLIAFALSAGTEAKRELNDTPSPEIEGVVELLQEPGDNSSPNPGPDEF